MQLIFIFLCQSILHGTQIGNGDLLGWDKFVPFKLNGMGTGEGFWEMGTYSTP